jgi:hypothetical protein
MKPYFKILIGILIGGLAGFAYYYFIGCQSGTCPITSNWHISTVYGAAMGLVATFPTKKKNVEK